MDDTPELVETVAIKHIFHWDIATQLPNLTFINALKTTELKNAKIQEILADLQWRMHDAIDSKKEIERLRLLTSAIANRAPAAAAPAATVAPAASGGDEAVRIKDLEEQLQAAVEENKLQKGLLDEEKRLFAVARVLASDPVIHVETDEVVALQDRIERQEAMIEHLTERARHWRDSTNSTVLQDLLDQLQHVLRLSLDDPGHVYTAVAEAIYENTSPDQRNTIDDAPSNKAGWIAYIAGVLQEEQSESDAPESGAGEPNSDGIELVRPDSASASKQNENRGYAKRGYDGIKSAFNNVRGISKKNKTDMSALLSDLKHASENGSSFTNNICSVDAELPPT
jgi:hypothetical protein